MTDLTDVGWVRKAADPLADRAPAGMRDLTLELAGDLSTAARQVEAQLSRLAGAADSALAVLRAGGSLTLGPTDPGQLHRLGDAVATYEAKRASWMHLTDALGVGE